MYAYLAPCTPQTKGEILEAILTFGMYQTWPNLALDPAAAQAYNIVKQLIEREIESYQKFCKEQKQKAKKLWDKTSNHAQAVAMPPRQCQTKQKQELKQETKPKQEAKQENTLLLTAQACAAQDASNFSGEKETTHQPPDESAKNQLQTFANEVIKHFEAHVQTDAQKSVWFRRNCRCLKDILAFCGQDNKLALQTIYECIMRLKKDGLSGGYEAVCRNLPEYYAKAKSTLEEEYGYTK